VKARIEEIAELRERTGDAARPTATEKQHQRGKLTASPTRRAQHFLGVVMHESA
jgi:acetyl-CoA carboxylase carboxyltransferase component